MSGWRVVEAFYPADFERLRAVREPVFVVEQNCPIEEEWDALDPPSVHALALDEQDRPVATGRLTPQQMIGRMAVLPEYRGSGVGAGIMEFLIERARQLAYPELSLSSQCHAIPFYERFGFVAEGEEYLDANIPHRLMRRSLLSPEAEGTLRLHRGEEARLTALDLLRGARHRVALVTQHLDAALFDNEAAIHAFKRIARSGRGARIQILVDDIQPAVASGHRLIELMQRLSTPFEVRRVNREYDGESGAALILTDADGWMRRPDPSRFDGEARLADRAGARELWRAFERAFERGQPETALRALKM